MVTLIVVPVEGPEDQSPSFASNDKKYQDYIDHLAKKYSLESVEKATIFEGTNKIREGVFDMMPYHSRTMTNFNQFLREARRYRF